MVESDQVLERACDARARRKQPVGPTRRARQGRGAGSVVDGLAGRTGQGWHRWRRRSRCHQPRRIRTSSTWSRWTFRLASETCQRVRMPGQHRRQAGCEMSFHDGQGCPDAFAPARRPRQARRKGPSLRRAVHSPDSPRNVSRFGGPMSSLWDPPKQGRAAFSCTADRWIPTHTWTPTHTRMDHPGISSRASSRS